ncbi:uncharacterized protein LOC118182431 isoform X2 [Stegodyphus dumicola]|nr:uncharacterized protein LOC118182431 isoform X2 [Stegodyphus dumicola]
MASAFLLCVVVALMFAGSQSESMSKSCSFVNGKMQCEEQRSQGNIAMSSSQAGTGSGGDYMRTAAGTGNTGTGSFSSSQSSSGNVPPGFNPFAFVPGYVYGPQQTDEDSGYPQTGFNPFAFVPGFVFGPQQQDQPYGYPQTGFNPFAFAPGFVFRPQQQDQPYGDEPPRANPNPFGGAFAGGFAVAGPGVAVGAGNVPPQGFPGLFDPFAFVFGR